MMLLTHLDGADVVVIDSHGRYVPAVEQVRVEPGLAVVSVTAAARAWLRDLLEHAANEPLACAVHSVADGHLHHCGATRVVYV
jgi:hypothetical protein